jgi:signal transduction histidine kinase
MVFLLTPAASAQSQASPTTPTNLPPLTQASQILALPPNLAKAEPSVCITGRVTYYEHGTALFVQDETAGVYVYYTGDRMDLKAGQYVGITGRAGQGRFSPIIDQPRLKVLPAGPSVAPRRTSLPEIQLGGLDAQWVELIGLVRYQERSGELLYLELTVPPHRIMLRVASYKGELPKDLLGSLVRVQGVVGTRSTELGELTGFHVFVNSISDIDVLHRPPADLFAQPVAAIGSLAAHFTRLDPGWRVRVKGVVTHRLPEGKVILQDDTGGLEAELRSPGELPELQDEVEVSGVAGPILDMPRLDDGVLRKTGSRQALKPVRALPKELFAGRHNLGLVELEAALLNQTVSASNRITFALEADGHLMVAHLQGPSVERAVPRLEAGSLLRLTGVCRSRKSADIEPRVELLLRSAADLEVIRPPPAAGMPGRVWIMGMLGVLGVALGASLWYLWRQHRQTERMLEFQASLQAEMLQGEQQLRRSLEERDRIGRDLHDDIIQTIYAVGLNLEDCRRVVRQSPQQAEARVGAAIDTLNSAIRSVRSFITGLEPKVLNGRELKTALKSIALTSGESSVQFKLDVDPSAANALTSSQATQLLHIAKEAISNSLRHAEPSHVRVSLDPVPGGVRLEVRDDGAGFTPEKTGGLGHGLRNMSARARELGADLQIVSSPGEGCSIVVAVPQRNSNESR